MSTKTCFVIMPFSDYGGIVEQEWTTIYDCLLKPAIEDCNLGYECKRSEIRNGAFTKDINLGLKHSKVVLADITYFNPNVMWELGYAEAADVPCVLLNQFVEKSPFDLSHIRQVPYRLAPTDEDEASLAAHIEAALDEQRSRE